jgi:hypothetical protein
VVAGYSWGFSLGFAKGWEQNVVFDGQDLARGVAHARLFQTLFFGK